MAIKDKAPKKTAADYYRARIEHYRQKHKEWEARNPEKRAAYAAQYRLNSFEKRRAYSQMLLKKCPWKLRARVVLSRARKRGVVPPWVDTKALQSVYQNCPPGFEVDHIIPMRGKTVCGLHVPWNLQYLSRSANRKKSNKLCVPST